MKKLVALVLAALMLFACTALAEIDPSIPTDQTTEIVFWHSFTGDDEAALLAQIEAFQAEYPYIAVKPQYIGGYNDIHTELASANAAGVGVPALCVINVPRLTSYAKDDVVEDLNPYIEAFADQINFADFYDGMTTAMNNDGKQTALPFGQSGQIFYYNKTLLSELGVTFPEKLEDMDAFLKTVSEATGKPALEIHGADNAYFYCMFCNLGAYMIDVDTNTTGLDAEVALDLIKRIRSWVDAGYVKWVDTDVGNTLRLDFTSGATASVLYTSSLQLQGDGRGRHQRRRFRGGHCQPADGHYELSVCRGRDADSPELPVQHAGAEERCLPAGLLPDGAEAAARVGDRVLLLRHPQVRLHRSGVRRGV